MTREELVAALEDSISKNDVVKVRHKNMRTVEFFAMSVTSGVSSAHHKLMGWWICLQTGEPVAQEVIKIKKEDLKDWEIV